MAEAEEEGLAVDFVYEIDVFAGTVQNVADHVAFDGVAWVLEVTDFFLIELVQLIRRHEIVAVAGQVGVLGDPFDDDNSVKREGSSQMRKGAFAKLESCSLETRQQLFDVPNRESRGQPNFSTKIHEES